MPNLKLLKCFNFVSVEFNAITQKMKELRLSFHLCFTVNIVFVFYGTSCTRPSSDPCSSQGISGVYSKLLCWPADIHSVTRSPHPSSSFRIPATKVAKRRAQGRNLRSGQNGSSHMPFCYVQEDPKRQRCSCYRQNGFV